MVKENPLSIFQRQEVERLTQFDPATWLDADGNPVAPMANEPKQESTDAEATRLLLESVRK